MAPGAQAGPKLHPPTVPASVLAILLGKAVAGASTEERSSPGTSGIRCPVA